MNRSISEEALRAAVERCGGGEEVTNFAKDLAAVLGPNEIALEIVQTTAPGFSSACAVTTDRLILGTGKEKVEEVPLAKLTYFGFRNEQELDLELHSLEARAVWHGFGERGARRILSALNWIFTFYKQADLSRTPEKGVTGIYDSWSQVVAQARAEQWETEKFRTNVVPVLANSRWW
ncbi:hypothetical protein [Corynebacterium lactis]|nr:hypothetical protein [Corynebacterium lactis]